MILRQFPTGESSIDREKYVWGKLTNHVINNSENQHAEN